MSGTTTISGQSRTEYSFYVCGNRHRNHTCDAPRIPAAQIDAAVIAAVGQLRFSDADVDRVMALIAAQQGKSHDGAESKRAELARVQKQLKNIVAAIRDGAYNDLMKDELNSLSLRETAIKAEIESMAASAPELPSRADVEEFLRRIGDLSAMDPENQRDVLLEIISKIEVSQNHTTITFGVNFGTRRVAGGYPHSCPNFSFTFSWK